MSDPDPAGVRFLDRRAGQCAWPLWGEDVPIDEKLCCGAPISTDRTYCAQHRAKGTGPGTTFEQRAPYALLKLSAKETVRCESEKL